MLKKEVGKMNPARFAFEFIRLNYPDTTWEYFKKVSLIFMDKTKQCSIQDVIDNFVAHENRSMERREMNVV